MKRAEFWIVASTIYPGKVSMRPLTREDGLRDALTKGGFEAGDQVVLVEKRHWDRLCAECRQDPTEAIDR
jgi:hypothetical protein